VTTLGAHVSTAGGLHKAPAQGQAIDAQAIQIFTRNQVQWRASPVGVEESAAFRAALAASGVQMAVAHGSYLVNLASPDPLGLQRSRDAFTAELERCQALGLPHLIFHPGAHLGAGEAAGLRTLAHSLDEALARAACPDVMPLLEVTAGQGTNLGATFEHLAAVLDRVRAPERLGVCLDTCHLYAAGYDIATPQGYEDTLARLERLVGLERVRALHLNDARRGLGSRLDRHAPIGEGCLGLEPFRRLMRDPRLNGRPMLLETPGGPAAWKHELALLRGLAARRQAATASV
jgi:deoxyribonuclease-4